MASDDKKMTGQVAGSTSGPLIGAMKDAVKRLINKSIELKSQVSKLREENEELKSKLQSKEEEITVLKQQLESYELGLALRGASPVVTSYSREEAKKKIGQMVREINECIALLKQ